MSERLDQRLAEFSAQLGLLPDTEEPPSTILHLIGRGKQERDWQRLLFHYLSADAPHGLGHALLDHLLTALTERDDLGYSASRFDLDDVQVECEVVTSNERRPDAVVWSGTDWFICWELKVGAAEGEDQTPDYVAADSFPGIGIDKTDVPTDGHYYVYLAPRDASPPKAEEFVPVSWEWVAAQIESFLAKSYGRYPARTTAQLNEFVDTIHRELTMTDYQENQREKAKLYFEYYDEIVEAQDAFEKQWDWFATNWGSQLAEVIRNAEPTEIAALRDTDVAVKPTRTSLEDERWVFRQGDSDWAGMFKTGWWRHKDDFSNIYTMAENKNDVRITFFHRLQENRDRAIKDGVLELQLWHGTGNGDQFMRTFKDELTTNVEESEREIPSSVSVAGSRGNPLTATYDIPVREQDDFFDAYVAALDDAFYDLVIDNQDLITIIDETFETTLEIFK